MANTKASKKNILRIKRNHDRNLHYRTLLKTSLKNAKQSILNLSDETEASVRSACRVIDKVTVKGILKKNSAARKKSRLVIALNKAKAASK